MKQTLIKYIGFLLLCPLFSSVAAEKSKGNQLEDYFVRLGYGVAVCKTEKPNKLFLEGVVGSKKLIFLVDTGWGITALDEGSARGLKTLSELGVTIEGPIDYPGAESVLMEKLSIGASQFLNQPATVRKLEMDFITREQDGILGCDFLLRNFCLLDCGLRRVYFRSAPRSAEQTKAMAESLRLSGFVEVAMHGDIGYTIDLETKNLEVRLLVDTGAVYSMLDESQVGRLSLTMEKRQAAETGTLIPEELTGRAIGIGAIGAHKFRVATLSAMQIGPRTWKNVHFGVVNMKSWGVGVPGRFGDKIQGVLGANFLMSSGALIDCEGGKIWFRPANAEHR